MTPVTQCQTQHNIPANRETIGAAVHAVVVETTIATKTNNRTIAAVAIADPTTVVTTAIIATVATTAARAAPKSSTRKARVPRVLPRR